MNNIVYSNIALYFLIQLVSLFYLVTTILYGAHFFRDNNLAAQYKQPALIVTVLSHIAYLGLLTSLEGYKLSYSTFNIMSMVALTLAITYIFIEFTTKSDKTGFFVLAFSAGAQFISSILTAQSSGEGPAFSGIGIGVHLIAAIFGFSAIAIAGLYSILYLLLFRQIQKNRFELLFQRLPNLEVLELLTMHAVAFGFLFLSITLFAGALEQKVSSKTISLFEPRLLTLIITWAIYGISIFVRPITGWDLKHMAYLFIGLFIFIVLLLLLMAYFSPSFHGLAIQNLSHWKWGIRMNI